MPVVEAFIKRCARTIDGAAYGDAAFSDGGAVWVGTREVAHAHDQGAVEIRLTKQEIRARRDELRADPRVTLRKNASDWIEFAVGRSATDQAAARVLVEVAVVANLATAKPGPPPTGETLARRKRWH